MTLVAHSGPHGRAERILERLPSWAAPLALFVVGFAVRLWFAGRMVFPPLDDPAFYLQTARNLAAGRGLMIDVIWSYQVPFAAVTHPSHEYWMPLATLLMAPLIRLLGDSMLAAQLPGVVCGALLAPITYGLGRLVWPEERWPSIAAGALLLSGAVPVYQSASMDSAAPFALFASLALLAGTLATERRSLSWSFAAGVLGGLAYLARSDGILVTVCLLGWAAARGGSRRWVARAFLAIVAGTLLLAAPWWLRNLVVFGKIQPVSAGAVAALRSYGQLFNWNGPPTLSNLLDGGLGFLLSLRTEATLHNLNVWLVLGFPYVLLGVPGLLMNRRPALWLGGVYGLALLFGSALIFSVPTMAGLFYHSAAATTPWLAAGAIALLRRLGQRRIGRLVATSLYLSSLILILVQAALAWPRVVETSKAQRAQFQVASDWLRAHAVAREPVIATQPHSLNYASGVPALMLPNEQGIGPLRDLARRYGARFVILTERAGLYPEVLSEAVDGEVRLLLDEGGVLIYELPEAQQGSRDEGIMPVMPSG